MIYLLGQSSLIFYKNDKIINLNLNLEKEKKIQAHDFIKRKKVK
jgi:hypothetical protein